MPNKPLNGVKACVFDAYGTLFDFASAARACPDVPADAAGRLTALWRDKQVQYTWLRAAQQRHADFRQVTADALDFSLETLGLERPGLRDRLLDLYLTLAAFPEVPEVLTKVRAAGRQTAILSNGTPAMLAAAVAAAGRSRPARSAGSIDRGREAVRRSRGARVRSDLAALLWRAVHRPECRSAQEGAPPAKGARTVHTGGRRNPARAVA
jgi:2-haloalkanoic acid dehalogenase type II